MKNRTRAPLKNFRESRTQGFSLVELLITTVVSIIVLGAVVLLMGQGLNMVGSNAAYSAAQRSALSAIEFLPREIAYSSQVEIISDPAHDITDALLNEDWHYIVRETDGVRHLYWDEERKEELIPGSELVTDLTFDADVFSSDQYGGGRVALFHVEAENNKKNVALDRSRLVHALEGVMGEDNASIDAAFPGGPILRYRFLPPEMNAEVNLFGSLNTDDEPLRFDYEKPDTWDRVKHYTFVTKIDATLKVAEEDLNRLDTREPPVFTWVVAQSDNFFSNHPELSGDLFDSLEHMEKQAKLLRALKEDPYLKSRLNDRKVGKKATANPAVFRKNPFERGYRVLEVSRGKEISADTYCTESYLNLGGILNTMLRQPGDYQGACLIVIAHFKSREGVWYMAPAFAALGGKYSSGNLWERVMDVINKTGAFEGGLLNQHRHFGKIAPILGPGYSRLWGFSAYGGSDAARRSPQILLTLTDKDFEHLKPKDPNKPNLYGVTNYSLYIEAQLTYQEANDRTPGGGYGVLLNGTEPQSVPLGNVKEHLSSGYMVQLNPSVGGFSMSYSYYKTPNLNRVNVIANEGYRLNVYDRETNVFFGVHPLYAYDAAKAYHGKPRTMEAPQIVEYFANRDPGDSTVLWDNHNWNVGVLNPEQRVFYRLPFMPQAGKAGGDKEPYYTRESVLRTFTRGRNKIGLDWRVDYGGPYGTTHASDTWSVYNLNHMQTWHLYFKEVNVKGTHDPSTKTVVDFPSMHDTRIGYRWDMHNVNGTAKGVPIALRTRHLIKITVLEVTRDILASEVEEGWRARMHHDGSANPRYAPNDVIHQAGDLFVRLEAIQVKYIDGDVENDINDSRIYYYSKPIWFGKFRGDYWTGTSASPLKRMGNRMMHIVSPPEPKGGDRKTFQRRSMRIRSWKDNFVGWDFDRPDHIGGTYTWKKDLIGANPPHPDLTVGDDAVWTPPIAIDLKGHGVQGDWARHGQFPTIRDRWQNPDDRDFGYNSVGANGKVGANNKGFVNDIHFNYQWGDRFAYTYGNYAFVGQKVEFERRRIGRRFYAYAYNGRYDDKIYGRLSMQRPYGDNTPLYGLYALRGWDYFAYELPGSTGKGPLNPVYDRNGSSYKDPYGAKAYQTSQKRLLMVVQGLQMPYQPSSITLNGEFVQPDLSARSANYYRRGLEGTPDAVYRKDRVRTLGLHFWSGPNDNDAYNPGLTKFYDMWFEEGFTPKEVRAILGLDPKQFTDSTLDATIPKLYSTE